MTLKIFGPFRVFSSDGTDRTPRSAKAQGMLLLLATAPNLRRARRWLQDKLWSDRAPEQGANSLRQELSQIRRAFADEAEALCADRQNVWLDFDCVTIDHTPHGELAEGLDVRDPEFEFWLACERSRAAERPEDVQVIAAEVQPQDRPVASQRRIFVDVCRGADLREDWVGTFFADHVQRMLNELYEADILLGQPVEARFGDMHLSVASQAVTEDSVALRAELRGLPAGNWQWSQHRVIDGRAAGVAEHPSFMQLGVEVAEAFGDLLIREQKAGAAGLSADLLVSMGVRHLFDIGPDDVSEADRCFARANELQDRALHWAWRAQARTVQRVELHACDLQEVRDEGARFAERALALDPNNSMVLALCANTYHILLLDHVRGMELADRAIQINPLNPMAWWAQSSARLYCGDTEGAYKDALRGRYLVSKSSYRFWWDLQLFISAMMIGRSEEAVGHMERCAAQKSNFRPPLRYLAAVKASAGDEVGAYGAVSKLRRLEHDFSVDRMLRDRDYPASLIHRAEVIDIGIVDSVF